MVKQVVVERMLKHIRSTTGFVTVELAIGIATLAFGFLAAASALGVFLTQLNLIDTAHNAARAAARGQQIELPANISLTQQFQSGAILIVAKRDLMFWTRAIELTAKAEVIVE